MRSAWAEALLVAVGAGVRRGLGGDGPRRTNVGIGDRFGRLTIAAYGGKNRQGNNTWRCACACGGERLVKTNNLTSGHTASCGCRGTGPAIADLTGRRFGRMLVTGYAGQSRWRGSVWRCVCDCGVVKTAPQRGLATGGVVSCGCHSLALRRRRGPDNPRYNPATPENIRARLDEAYLQFKNDVRRSRSWTCEACGARGSSVIHHKDNWKEHPALRLSGDNVALLCREHHLEFHRKYGMKGTTASQFATWMEARNV